MLDYQNYLPLLPFILVLATLALWRWYNRDVRLNIRESFFRNIGLPQRNLIAFVLGLIAALLPLTSGIWNPKWATWIFVGSLALIAILLVAMRPNAEKEMDRFSWGVLVIVILGFGVGAIIYQAHPWWVWLWNQYRRINEPHELVLEFLFLLGVILGVFVVRNWGKEQSAFTDSLSGLLGGTFIAGLFGEAFKGQGLTTMQALTYYGLGFAMSAAINLLYAARLAANYTNKRSITSRALLEFLYGRERVKDIDGYFQKNFEEDPNNAKRFLKDTLLNFRGLVQQEFAERLNSKMTKRLKGEDSEHCPELKEKLTNQKKVREELHKEKEGEEKKKKETELARITKEISALEGRIKLSYCYELVAIECAAGSKAADPSAAAVMDREHSVIYKRIYPKPPDGTEENPDQAKLEPNMVRVGVAIRRQDVLDYVVAPGQYLASFPYFGSVAGLSVIVRQTIVMDRDREKKFRSKDYRDGICPKDIEQWRGLDEIDFLSYVSIPIVSRLGTSSENPLGVVNIDTKLFLTRCKLEGEPVDKARGYFRTRLTPRQLNEFAANLYDQEDEDLKYIEKLTKIIEPVVELYAKCNIGAP
ncbi:MAG TPA: hypothetical protein VGO56_16780 [Pyrinomonadaceae bacterium]|jgi:hypothetical protein|nr:hypothetical protein [Pyrinomonadaceae bacterium]